MSWTKRAAAAEPLGELYVIRSNEGLFWNNDSGWGDLASAFYTTDANEHVTVGGGLVKLYDILGEIPSHK